MPRKFGEGAGCVMQFNLTDENISVYGLVGNQVVKPLPPVGHCFRRQPALDPQ